MSHHSETIEVRLSEVPPARTRIPAYGYNIAGSDSLPSRIISAALDAREMGDYDRNASPDVSAIQLLGITPSELAGQAIENVKDRSATVIVPIMDTKDYEIRKKTIKVSLDHKEWEDHRLGGRAMWKKIQASLPELAPNISSCRVLTESGAGATSRMEGWKVSSAIDVDTSGGKAKTVYQLQINGTVDPVNDYKTVAEARAAGIKVMEENMNASYVNVVAKVVREDGTSMVKMKRKVRSATAKVEVKYVHVTSKKPRLSHYWVSMWFHS